MKPTLKTTALKFAVDVFSGAAAAAIVAVLALNLSATDARTVAYAALAGALNGAINVARRSLVLAVTQPEE